MSQRDLEERLLSYLREHPGSSPREIADALGEPLQRVRAALARLRNRGLVARGEEGHYYVVAPAVRGLSRREVRRPVSTTLHGDLDALVEAIEDLRRRIEELEERVARLEERCQCKG
ncbi:BlaI/MecI/CopY family transcriptional regulator [Hyperthermus butylicus]|uniref:HTH marR-type domain-containing protein n=1 Tax=Hyperthermus butylicus (strain DSM 5456 / JCM 9403 / PLM1-5) TaxID=415426 RepID=A2BKQ1_HYPBU|nr:winged helix-turn-helix domain-containing protein [Hyperthermus butylicus]ABM80562.1 hypothetical protein Hbut_0707 [Hyperthermus butylicus DSM 5456]